MAALTKAQHLKRIQYCRDYFTTEFCTQVPCVPFYQDAAPANNNLHGFKPTAEGLQQLLVHPLLLPQGTQGHACQTALTGFR